MKKTFNINVAGFPFVIDEDAYNLLNDYLNTIEHAFKNVDGASELINDIESRVAELLIACTEDGSTIITLADVEQLIARVGKPEEFVEEASFTVEDPEGHSETIEVESERTTPPPYIPPLPTPQKRLFRDPQNAMLGGVCSGLAWYIGWDVTWIRLLLVALTICSYAVVGVVYLVLWIVVPEARTPLQRMQMMGEQPTMENIGKTVTDSFKEEQGTNVNPQPTTAPQTAGFLANTFSLLAKIMIIVGLIIGIPLLVALAVGLIGCIFFMIMWGTTLLFGTGLPFEGDKFNDPYISQIVFWGVLCGIGWIITIAIPLFYLVRKGMNSSPLTKRVRMFLNILWVIGFILAACATGMIITVAANEDVYDQLRMERRYHFNEQVESTTIIETDNGSEAEIEMVDTLQITSMLEDKIQRKANKLEDKIQRKADKIVSKAEKLAEKAEKLSDLTLRIP